MVLPYIAIIQIQITFALRAQIKSSRKLYTSFVLINYRDFKNQTNKLKSDFDLIKLKLTFYQSLSKYKSKKNI